MHKEIIEIYNKYNGRKGNTILILQEIQNTFGYLPEEALLYASEVFKKPISEFLSVASFYSQFKFYKPGKHQIKVCHGTACHINGAEEISSALEDALHIEAGKTTTDGDYSLDNVACLGCCSLAPVVMVDDDVYGKVKNNQIKKIINKYNGK